ncbi:MAG: lipopolysaccharide biosynthesis protein [Puniceicoccaceae bacterium]
MFKLDKRISGGDKYFALADSGVLSLGRFFFSIAIARLCLPGDFSQYVVIVSLQYILATILSTTHITPVINLAPGLDGPERRAFFKWAHRRVLKAEAVIGLSLVAAAIPVIKSGISGWHYAGCVLATLALIESGYHRGCIQSIFQTRWALLADGIAILLTVTAITGALYAGMSPLLAFWWGSAAGGLVASLMMQAIWKKGPSAASPPVGLDAELQANGMAMLRGSVANSLCSRIQPSVLSSLGGTMAVAHFGAAWTLVGPMRMMSAALNGILRPRLSVHRSNADNAAFNKLLMTVLGVLFGAGLCGLVLFFPAGEFIAAMIFGEALAGAGKLLPLAVAYGTLDAMTTTLMIAMQVGNLKGARAASRMRIEAAILSMVLLVPACLYMGAAGALGSLLIAEILYAVRASLYLTRNGFPLLDTCLWQTGNRASVEGFQKPTVQEGPVSVPTVPSAQ